MISMADTLLACKGKAHGAPGEYAAVSTDSRSIKPGELFVALRGERFDGHAFVRDVLAAGAAAAMVDGAWVAANDVAGLKLIEVADTRAGFAALAHAWRMRFEIPVIGVVGSNGKTTVKEMIAAILAAEFGDAQRLATTGNLNNDIGVPTMLLRLNAQHRAAVIEMGMNHPGETALLAACAQATVAIINNAQREHQEFMKSVAAVAEEHGAVLAALPVNGVAVLNADDEHFGLWGRDLHRAVLSFGFKAGADVSCKPGVGATSDAGVAALCLVTPQGEAEVELATVGEHNARNALGAAAAALAAGCSLEAIVRGLAAFRPVKGRLQLHHGQAGCTLVDDTYNANPDSVRAAIDVLADRAGRRVLVLGDMGEVGEQAPEFHREVGAYAAARGVDALLTLGETSAAASAAFGAAAAHFDKLEKLLAALKPLLDDDTTVLVKGSRFMKMERVVEAVRSEE